MPEMKISFLGTGSGSSTNRAHTAIVYDCDDGTRPCDTSGATRAHGLSRCYAAADRYDTGNP